MIKADELREFRPNYRYADGTNVTLENIQLLLSEKANEYGIPIAFGKDQVKSGGIFNKVIEECLIIYHPQHPYDYFRICVRVQKTGNMAVVYVNDYGQSTMMNKFDRAEAARQDRQGQSASYKVGSIIGSAIRNAGRNKQKLEEEQNYYGALEQILDEVIS